MTPVVTVAHDGAVIDCVAFEHQPALIGAAPDVVRQAVARKDRAVADNRRTLATMSPASQPHRDLCPPDTVGLARFRLLANPQGDAPQRCLPPVKRRPAADLGSSSHSTVPSEGHASPTAGYSYDYAITDYINVAGANDSYALFSVGTDGVPLATCRADTVCHSLNQLWWLTTDGGTPDTRSLETGWIASNYFTTQVTTSFFVFSTNDDYHGDKDDQYNAAGGFVQYPGGPIIFGAPVSNASYALSYSRTGGDANGATLYGFPISAAGSTAYSWPGSWVELGTYLPSRFASGAAFDYFGAGLEVCIADGEASDATASGRILGWGTSQANQAIKGAFACDPPGDGLAFAYTGGATWSPACPYADAQGDLVQFSGSPKA